VGICAAREISTQVLCSLNMSVTESDEAACIAEVHIIVLHDDCVACSTYLCFVCLYDKSAQQKA
jgi:hypothetical protein